MSRPTLTVLPGGRHEWQDWQGEWWWIALRKIGQQLLADSASPITAADVSQGESVTSPVGDGLTASSWPPAGAFLPERPSRRPQLHLVPAPTQPAR
ncbi:MAG: hypothetical protein ABMA25_00685 [Ilumatobacteraceae bacterium]